jgi:hypothetical protein
VPCRSPPYMRAIPAERVASAQAGACRLLTCMRHIHLCVAGQQRQGAVRPRSRPRSARLRRALPRGVSKIVSHDALEATRGTDSPRYSHPALRVRYGARTAYRDGYSYNKALYAVSHGVAVDHNRHKLWEAQTILRSGADSPAPVPEFRVTRSKYEP